MADMIKFYKGELTNLPSAGANGALYITTDEGAIYLGTGVGMKRLGDFVQVDAVANLPTAGANTSALYYCVAENVLAKWNGTEWKQVNKQPTKDELKVMLGLDATGVVTQAIAAAKKAGDDAQEDVDNLTTYVGTFTHSTAKSVVEYIDAKTDGIATSGNLEALADRVAQAEKDIDAIEADYLKAADKTELTGKITAVQTAVDNEKTRAEGIEAGLRTDINAIAADYLKAADKTTLQDNIDGVADRVLAIEGDYLKGEDKTSLENKMAKDIADAVKAEADLRVAADDAIKATIGDVAEGKTIVKMIEEAQAAATYDDTALSGRVTTVEGKVSTIEGDYLKASDKTELQGNIDGVSGRVSTIEGDYLKDSDKTELQGKIDLKAAQTALDAEIERATGVEEDLQNQINLIMNNPDTKDVIDSIAEFTQYIADHGAIAEGFRADIDQNKADISAMDKAYKAADTALSGRLDVLEAIEHDAYIAADTALKSELEGKINAKADTTALNSAVQALESADTGLGNRITDLETASATHATKTEVQAVSDALTEYKNEHKNDYDNDAVDAKVKGVQDQIDALGDTYATDKELTDAIAAEVERANGAYAAKSLESTVDTHIGNGDIHVTTEDKAKWNAAEQNAKDYADAQVAAAKEDASNKDAVVLSEAQKAVTAAKTELQTALDTYKTSNDAAVAGKADKATTLAGYGITDAMTADAINALFQWGEF